MKQYTRTHEWVEIRDGKAYVGISAHAADELGEVVYVDLTVAEVNDELADAPEKAGESWIFAVEPFVLQEDLMSEAEYSVFLG